MEAKQERQDRKRAEELGRTEIEEIIFQGQGCLTKFIILEGKFPLIEPLIQSQRTW